MHYSDLAGVPVAGAWMGASVSEMLAPPGIIADQKGKIGIVKRYYFHLVDGNDIIPDHVGVEATDLEEARREALKAIHEFRRESPGSAAEWKDWRIDVADDSGTTLLSINLSDLSVWENERKRISLM